MDKFKQELRNTASFLVFVLIVAILFLIFAYLQNARASVTAIPAGTLYFLPNVPNKPYTPTHAPTETPFTTPTVAPTLTPVPPSPTATDRPHPSPTRRPASDKKGLSIGSQTNHDDVYTVNGKWLYDWTRTPPCLDGIDSVPMMNTDNPNIGGCSDWVLGVSEPDRFDRSNMTPSEGALLWRAMEDFYPYLKFVSPAPSQQDPDWINRFVDEYIFMFEESPRIDALGVHCYANTADVCITYVQGEVNRAIQLGIPEVWVTEFAFTGTTMSNVIEETTVFMAYMEQESMITRYSIFTNRAIGAWWDYLALWTIDGQITIRAEQYINYP